MSTPEALFEAHGALAILTFNRPDARNAMTWAMYEALVEACDRVDADRGIAALVLRGAGGAFVAGTDITQFAAFATAADGVAYERRLDAAIDRLERVRAPTIAEVAGVAAGGGCAIAFACDLRICTPAARFGVPIARTLGNCLSAATCARFVDLIGPARTKELLLTGRFMDAHEAQTLGLVTRLVGQSDVHQATEELVAQIAPHAPLTMHAVKETLRRLAARRRVDAADVDDLIELCYGSHDFHEGVEAFREKRTPRFSGR